MKKEFVELRINRRQHELAVEPGALRQDLGLTESSAVTMSHALTPPYRGEMIRVFTKRGVLAAANH
jgi:hypothetical protein